MTTEEEYPIGTEIEMMYDNYLEIPKGTIGKVIGYNKRVGDTWLIIDWGGPALVNSTYGWDPSKKFAPNRFRIVKSEAVKSEAVKNIERTGNFCSCGSKNVIENTADGKPFLYCRDCKKERQSEVRV